VKNLSKGIVSTKKDVVALKASKKSVIPRSEIVGTKPLYVCPKYFIHTYSNNMINRFYVQ
jgi:hypothetical protein